MKTILLTLVLATWPFSDGPSFRLDDGSVTCMCDPWKWEEAFVQCLRCEEPLGETTIKFDGKEQSVLGDVEIVVPDLLVVHPGRYQCLLIPDGPMP